MAIDFGEFPVALMMLVIPILLIYCYVVKRSELRTAAMICIGIVLIVALYPIIFSLTDALSMVGYLAGKLLLFVLLPLTLILYVERWKIREAFWAVGLRRKRLGMSLLLGVLAAAVTIAIVLAVAPLVGLAPLNDSLMFFESFNEEFFFRGVLMVYLAAKIDVRIAYVTSIAAFVLAHGQYLTDIFMISAIAQGVLLAVVAHRTKNIVGTWVSHGLNRLVPHLIGAALGA